MTADSPMDPRPLRTMTDMGMGSMKGMKIGNTASVDVLERMKCRGWICLSQVVTHTRR